MSILETAKPQTVSKVQNSDSLLQLLFYLKLKTGRRKTAQQIRKKSSFRGLSFCLKPETSRHGLNGISNTKNRFSILAENRKPERIRKRNRETLNRKRHKADPTNGQMRKTEISTALIRCS